MSKFGGDSLDEGYGLATFPGMGTPYEPYEEKILVGVNTTLPWTCDRKPGNSTDTDLQSEVQWMQYFHLPNNSESAYLGKASVMAWDGNSLYGNGAADTSISGGRGYFSGGLSTGGYGCPTVSVTVGTARLISRETQGNKTKFNFESDFTTIMCYQHLEQVLTEVNFQLPDLTINKLPAPKPDEPTSHMLRTSKDSSINFEFPINSFLLTLGDRPNTTIPSPGNGDEYNNDLDPFVKALLTNKNAKPIEQLLGEENIETLVDVSSKLYSSYMAQAISQNMRSIASDTEKLFLPSYEGEAEIPGRQRLQQNNAPKIALQAMLGVMAVCAIIANLLVRVRDVLPHNPCSIAGTATLLAGSEMCTRKVIPEGSEWMDEQPASVFLDGWNYRLGWWGEGERRRFGIDVQGEKM